MFVISKTDYLQVTCAFQMKEDIWELSELNTKIPRKMTISSALLIR